MPQGWCTALAAPLSAEGDPRPGIWDVITPDAIATTLFNVGITVLRTEMEVRYDYLTPDVARGSFAVAGLSLRPRLWHDDAGQCEITVDRATITQSGGTLGLAFPLGVTAGSVNFIGVEATAACLEPEFSDMARAVGMRRLVLDQARIDIGYDVASGEVSGAMTLGIEGLAQIDLRARGTYLTIPGELYYAEPAVRMHEAVMTLRDDGGWGLVAPMLPGDFRNPEVIREVGTELLVDLLGEGAQLGATDRLFIDQLMARVADYVADPGEITLEANLPPSGVVVSESSLRAPVDIVRVLALTARTSPQARAAILPIEELATTGAAGPQAQLTLARALLAGDGVPRSAAMAIELANPLVASTDAGIAAQAALLIAQAELPDAPETAYEFALVAAGAGLSGAVAVLDAAETRMTTQTVLAAQPALGAEGAAPLIGRAGVDSDDPRDLRAAALARLYGVGAARSYAQAYYFALLAEAAGDIAATSLVDEIDARFAQRGPDAAQAWSAAREGAEMQALADWIALDLPARYTRD